MRCRSWQQLCGSDVNRRCLNEIRVEAKLDHVDISSAVSMKPDIIITAENFRTQFEKFALDPTTAIIYLRNIVSKPEIEEKSSQY